MRKDIWFLIVNPTSGSFSGKRKWRKIATEFEAQELLFDFEFTTKPQHEYELVIEALEKGYRKFVSVGGDGTLHHIVNGLMEQKLVPQQELKVAVIPLGTGNDWVKTYKIPKNIKKAVAIIKAEYSVLQDIGHISLLNSEKKVFFNNVAGLGFDGYVVKRNERLKFLGAVSFLVSTVLSLASYKSTEFSIKAIEKQFTTKSLLTIVGVCQFSGGGMQLTKDVHPADGLFDVSVAKHFTLWKLLVNVVRLFNGSITNHPLVETFKTNEVTIETSAPNVFIQADGELIGTGGFTANILPKALVFVVLK
ncbi:diacylglycerol kinase family lipid kinase [Kordia sp. YSTF-M3]|uniref:Diacylglycerol kinase family lipid kinase n=1 Tax=Kordia aestuariivivens TaxID=2759037 RepID=A0ABR7QES5_9FLAO|nr:diacylglycerol kinase family protein [Kordia aestuariivivens]MBC8756923.1 diacylglycerol kinase family lipid kinase [Kordia aestuariivivens]